MQRLIDEAKKSRQQVRRVQKKSKYEGNLGPVGAFVDNLAQEASLGYSDEIAGGMKALFTGKPYEEARQEEMARLQAHRTKPVSYTHLTLPTKA